MGHVTYAYVGPVEAAGRLAKKGTESDVVLFNAKHDESHLNLVAPAKWPERAQCLLAAFDLADRVILHAATVDRAFGEAAVGAQVFGKTSGFVRLADATLEQPVRRMLQGTLLADLVVTGEPDGVLRERLFSAHAAPSEGPVVVPVDHAFPVKGVGTVVLGVVRRGTLNRHADLQAYPGDETVSVRSIQIHDVEHDEAPTGARTGLALKGVEAEDVPRGTVLAEPGSLRTLEPEADTSFRVTWAPHRKWEPRTGTTLHLFHALQDVVFRVDAVEGTDAEGATLRGRLDRAVALVEDQPVVLMDYDNKANRFVGRARPST